MLITFFKMSIHTNGFIVDKNFVYYKVNDDKTLEEIKNNTETKKNDQKTISFNNVYNFCLRLKTKKPQVIRWKNKYSLNENPDLNKKHNIKLIRCENNNK